MQLVVVRGQLTVGEVHAVGCRKGAAGSKGSACSCL